MFPSHDRLVNIALAPLAIEYLVVPVVPPGAEPTFAIGLKPKGASMLAIVVS